MFLIDKPYISDFLIHTIKENKFKIIATETATSLINDTSLNWVTEKEAIQLASENENTPIYSNSENSISWIENNLQFSEIPSQIEIFKNKIHFREIIADFYPNYFFKGVKFEELESVDVSSLKFPLIIKPTVGFFSLGVHKVDNSTEWNGTISKIKQEINHIKSYYPLEVLDTSNFIIEECIEGNEYAVDCYFNKQGEPIVLNIMHHLFSSGKDVSDRIYSTSKNIIEENLYLIEEFLIKLNAKINLKNFPIHIEVRIDEKNNLNPIEVNPMRFGGWCTTGDLAWYAYGINSYEYFMKNQKPDWETILNSRNTKKYSIVLLDNNSGFNEKEIESFNYSKLLNDFEKPLSLRKVDFNKFPLFGILFTETTLGKENELETILKSNLKKYIELKKIASPQ